MPTFDPARLDSTLNRLLDAADILIDAITDEETLEVAPLNQRAAALGVVSTFIGRLAKLKEQLAKSESKSTAKSNPEPAPQPPSDPDPYADKLFMVEYIDEQGITRQVPLSTVGYSGKQRALQSDRLRQTLRQDGDGQTSAAGSARESEGRSVVDRADQSDGG